MSTLLALGALAVGVRLVLALYQRPQRGILLLVALVPFHGLLLLVDLPGVVGNWKEAVVALTVMASLAPGPDRRPLRWTTVPPWLLWAVALFALGSASAVLVGGMQGILGWKVAFFYSLLVVPLLRTPLTRKDRNRLLTVLVVTATVAALVGVWQQVVGGAYLNAIGYPYNDVIRTTQGRLRSFSTFDQPFPFAFFVVFAICVALPTALAAPRRPSNAAFLLLLPLLALGVGTAFVRAALLGLATAFLVLAYERRTRLGWLVLAACLPVLLVPGQFTGALLSSTSLGERITAWTAKLTALFDAPFGHGVGSSGSASETLAGPGRPAFQPDNAYFHVCYQLGPIGLWLLVHLMVALVVVGLRLSRTLSREDRPWALGIALASTATATAATVANYFEIFPVDLLFWVSVGLLAALDAERRDAARSPGGGLGQPSARLPGAPLLTGPRSG